MKKLIPMILGIAILMVAVGCGSDDKAGKQAQPGDYGGPPGGAKAPEAGSPAPKTGP